MGVRGRRAETLSTRETPSLRDGDPSRAGALGASPARRSDPTNIPFIYASLRGDQGVRRRRTARTSFQGRATIHETRARRRGGARAANPTRSRPARRQSPGAAARTRCSDRPVARPTRRSHRSSPVRPAPTGSTSAAARPSRPTGRRPTLRRRPRHSGARRPRARRTDLPAGRASRATDAPRPPRDRSRRPPAGRSMRSSGSGGRTAAWAASRLVLDPQHREEGLLRDLDRSHHLHPLLAFLLFLEQLFLSGDVAAVALRDHVFALRADVLARDDLSADRRLDAPVQHLLGDETAQLVDEKTTDVLRLVAVHDDRQRVDERARDEDVEAHEVGGAVLAELVVKRGVALRAALELIVEIDDDLGQWHVVLEHRARRVDIRHLEQRAALVLREIHDRPDVVRRRDERRLHPRLADLLDRPRIGEHRRVVDRDLVALLRDDAVFDRRRGRDEVHVVLALEPLLDDLEMEQAEEAAAETEAERL